MKKIARASKIQLPKGYLSPTQINMYWRCGKQYEFRYILGIKNPPGVNLVDGSSHHDTLDNNNKHKIKTGNDRSDKYLVQRFCDIFSDQAKEIPKKEWMLADTTKDKVIKRGKIIQAQYRKYFAPNLTPEFSEEEVTFKVGDVKVKGYIDVGGKYKLPSFPAMRGVFDYKITGRKKSLDEVENSIQLSHYGWGAIDLMKGISFQKPPYVGFCSLLKTGSSIPVLQAIKLVTDRIKWYRLQVASVADAISRGSFPVRNGTGWECSPRFCGFYNRCKGKVWKG